MPSLQIIHDHPAPSTLVYCISNKDSLLFSAPRVQIELNSSPCESKLYCPLLITSSNWDADSVNFSFFETSFLSNDASYKRTLPNRACAAPFVAAPIEDLQVDEDSDDVVIDLRDVFDDVENGGNLAFSFSENVAAMEASLDGSTLTLSFFAD